MSGQVISFPSKTPSLAGGRERTPSDGGGSTNKSLIGEEFLSVLRTNVAQAEEVVAGAEEGQPNEEPEPDVLAREEMLEPSFFGSFFGSVEERMAAFIAGQPTAAHAVPDFGHAFANKRVTGAPAGNSRLPASAQMVHVRSSGHSRVSNNEMKNVNSDSPGFALRKFTSLDTDASLHETDMVGLGLRVSDLKQDKGSEAGEGVVRSGLDSGMTVLGEVSSKWPSQHLHGFNRHESSRHHEREGAWERRASEPVHDDSTISLSDVTEFRSPDQRSEPVSATTQIAENIRTAVSTAVEPRFLLPGEVHKGIKFKLHPERLGEVEVRLRITGDKIAVSIKLERAEVATEIEQAKNDLCDMLDGCGMVVDFIEVGLSRSQRDSLPVIQTSMPTGDVLPTRLDDQRNSAAGNNGDSRQGAPDSFRHEHNDGKENLLVASDVSSRHLDRRGIFL